MQQPNFFDKPKTHSQIKAAIVASYFSAWSTIIWSQKRYKNIESIGYVDLFAGEGVYSDGTLSTPMLVLDKAIKNKEIIENLFCYFNDGSDEIINSLKEKVKGHPGYNLMKRKPLYSSDEVGHSIVNKLSNFFKIPTLFFLDPWGYKGLSLNLFNTILSPWGCDCIFFFNYNRINPGVSNKVVNHHMELLFGKSGASDLRERVKQLRPAERERAICFEMTAALHRLGYPYVHNFRIVDASSRRYHLYLVGKRPIICKIAKEITAKYCSRRDQGVPIYEYNVPYENKIMYQPWLLENLERPLDELVEKLKIKFQGKRMRVIDIFNDDHINTPYLLSNYKEALMILEKQGAVRVDQSVKERSVGGRVSMGEKRVVDFIK